jgi:hypothetical protein
MMATKERLAQRLHALGLFALEAEARAGEVIRKLEGAWLQK